MAGRYLTQEEMYRICRAAAEKAAATHGFKDINGFTQALMQVSWAESAGPTAEDGWFTWDTQSVHDQGQGFGLFALHNEGYAGNLSKEQRLDPQQNANAAAMKLGGVWQDGDTLEGNVTRMTGPQGQNPADPGALYRNAMSARTKVEQQMQPSELGAGWQPYGARGQAAGTSLGEWLEQQGYATPFPEDWAQPPGSGGIEWFNGLPAAMKESVYGEWREATGRGAEAGVPDWEREATEARTAVNWADARRIIETLGGETYEQGRQRILDQFEEKKWTEGQAISEFNAWMSGALEAGKRAETVYGEEMKRKAWTTPGEFYPGTEPGGMNQQMYERYGLGEQYKPSPGVPVSQLPNLDEMYGQWHGRMGISEQAPPTQGGWQTGAPGGGAPMGGQGTGMEAAQSFLEQIMKQYAPQFGAGRA